MAKLQNLILIDDDAVDAAIDSSINSAMQTDSGAVDADRTQREIKQIEDTVTALTVNLDPENIALINNRFTQLRLR